MTRNSFEGMQVPHFSDEGSTPESGEHHSYIHGKDRKNIPHFFPPVVDAIIKLPSDNVGDVVTGELHLHDIE